RSTPLLYSGGCVPAAKRHLKDVHEESDVGGRLMRKPQLPVLAILFILGGCTGPRVRVAPPSSALRAEILSASLDVTSRGGPAEVETPIKGKGRGALVGAGLGALCCLTTVGIPADSGV